MDLFFISTDPPSIIIIIGMNRDFAAILDRQSKLLSHPSLPRLYSVWRHYKGGLYMITGYVMKESTEDLEICYTNINHSLLLPWIRPFSQWHELVSLLDPPVPRFTPVTAPISVSIGPVKY